MKELLDGFSVDRLEALISGNFSFEFGQRQEELANLARIALAVKQAQPVVLDAIDTNLIEALRLVQCMLDDYRERNYGDAQGWIRHINTHMSDYTEAHGDDAYSVLHNLITAAPKQEAGS